MSPPGVYLRAAKLVYKSGFGGCHALRYCGGDYFDPDWRELFGDGKGWYWWRLDEEGRNQRVLALLFMAEIAKERR